MSKENQLQSIMDKAVSVGIEKDPAVRDILTDVMHLCDKYGVHFQKAMEGVPRKSIKKSVD